MSIDMLRALAEGRIHHLNNGLCPDVVSGHESRDPDCVVCRALAQPDGADPNAPWLSEAHAMCFDQGIPAGHITDRIKALREKLDRLDDKAQPVAWMDDFGNVFPLAANKGAGSWMDEHKRNWKPLYAAPQPPADRAARGGAA